MLRHFKLYLHTVKKIFYKTKLTQKKECSHSHRSGTETHAKQA